MVWTFHRSETLLFSSGTRIAVSRTASLEPRRYAERAIQIVVVWCFIKQGATLLCTSRARRKGRKLPTCTSTCFPSDSLAMGINPLNPELNPICYLLALLGAHHFLHVSRIRVKSLTIRQLMSYIYGAPILDVSRSHTTTHHSR